MYQQDQAGWEWAEQDDQRRQADRASAADRIDSQKIVDHINASFDNIFMNEGE